MSGTPFALRPVASSDVLSDSPELTLVSAHPSKAIPSVSLVSQAEEVIAYLNAKTGYAYQARSHDGRVTAGGTLTIDRIKQHGKDALTRVIDAKCAEWLGGDMAKYLRPETLFGKSKFDSYLGQAAKPVDESLAAGVRSVIAIYHEVLPTLPVAVYELHSGSEGVRDLEARWQEDARHRNLDFWRAFFATVRTNPHWMGEDGGSFKASLWWLARKERFATVVELMVTNARAKAVANG